ncbi:hypothetical protein [Bacillus mycoides]|nr:hypothetical protein [Bacillus mycoides]
MGTRKFVKELEMTKEEIVELFLNTIDETKPELVEEYIEESFRI